MSSKTSKKLKYELSQLIELVNKGLVTANSEDEGNDGSLQLTIKGNDFKRKFGGMLQKIGFIIDELYFHCWSKKILIQVIDSSHVCLAEIDLNKASFNDYELSESAFKVGANVQDLIKLIKAIDNDEEITFIATPKAIKFGGFTLKPKEIQGYDYKEEMLVSTFKYDLEDKFTASFTISAKTLEKFVKKAIVISDLAKLKVKDGGIYISAYDESGEYEELICDVDAKEGEGVFSLNFLENVIKPRGGKEKKGKGKQKKKTEEEEEGTEEGKIQENMLEIHFGINTPILVIDPIDKFSTTTWLIAPRVDEQEKNEIERIDMSMYDQEVFDYIVDQLPDRLDELESIESMDIDVTSRKSPMMLIVTFPEGLDKELVHKEITDLVEKIANEKETDIEVEKRHEESEESEKEELEESEEESEEIRRKLKELRED